jgi:ferric-dicitrate binding protein FerR (iron transport regulator)
MNFAAEELSPEQKHRMYSNILQGIGKSETSATPAKKPLSRQLRPAYFYRAAAAIVILAVAGLAGWQYLTRWAQTQYVTGYAQMQTVVLPDGSEVVLNANSKLSFPTRWQHHSEREVWLQGEAYFQVQKETRNGTPVKFRVHTGELSIEVLGTQFSVSGRQENTHVVLNEGSIRLAVPTRTGTENILMEPGEMVEYHQKDKGLIRRRVNAEVYSSWKSNKWILENTSLAQVGKRIEDTYGVKVRIPDRELARESMTGVLPTHSLEKLLEVLSAAYGLKVHRTEDQIILDK